MQPQEQSSQQRKHLGNKFCMLFGNPSDKKTLLVGPHLATWKDFFPDSVHWDIIPHEIPDLSSFGLILFCINPKTSHSQIVRDLNQLKIKTQQDTNILLIANNYYSLTSFKKLLRKTWCLIQSFPKFGFRGYKKVIQESGFIIGQTYLIRPNILNPEEIVAVDSHLLEIPYNSNILVKTASRFNFYKYVAESYLFSNSNSPLEKTSLINDITSELYQKGYLTSSHCHLERFDLRIRGALVLFLADDSRSKHFITRVVDSEESRIIIKRNEKFIKWLLNQQRLNEDIKDFLPVPIVSFEKSEVAIFIETMMHGTLAWKVNRYKIREKIFQEASDFISRLQYGTRLNMTISPGLAHDLYSVITDRLNSCDEVSNTFLQDVKKTIEIIKQKIIEKAFYLTASHGDYGYGNILVDPHSGKLIGVIDWDTGRRLDFAGIDYLNLLVQRKRSEENCNVYQAFHEVITRIQSQNSLDISGYYKKFFNISNNTLKLLLYTGFLRYISRSAQYPQVYQAEEKDYIRVLEFLKIKTPL